MVLRRGHEAELRRLGASAIRLLRIEFNAFLGDQSSLPARPQIHLSQSQAFAILFLTSDTALKLETSLFHFSISAARRLYRQVSIVRQ